MVGGLSDTIIIVIILAVSLVAVAGIAAHTFNRNQQTPANETRRRAKRGERPRPGGLGNARQPTPETARHVAVAGVGNEDGGVYETMVDDVARPVPYVEKGQ